MICMLHLSHDGCGVKNVEMATALHHSKPSVHNTLRSLADAGMVTQQAFGLAHLTEEGRSLAEKYAVCFALVQNKMKELCGDSATTDAAICGILADMPWEKIRELCATSRQAASAGISPATPTET